MVSSLSGTLSSPNNFSDLAIPVANLPAEIAHLLEEIQAKDRVVQECRSAVNTRDNSIQKFLKANGCSQANPKEEAYVKNAMANFDKARIIQDEKVSLSEKAATLVSYILSASHFRDNGRVNNKL